MYDPTADYCEEGAGGRRRAAKRGGGENREVCGFPHFERSDFLAPVESSRTLERQHAQRVLTDEACGLGILPEVQVTHADHGVGSETYRDTGLAQQPQRRSTVTMRRVRSRTVGDGGFRLAQQANVGRTDLDTVNAQRPVSYDAKLYEVRNRRTALWCDVDPARAQRLGKRTGAIAHQFALRRRLGHVDRQWQSLEPGKIRNSLVERHAHGVGRVR